MSEREEARDWSELPPELVHVIAKKLPDLLDFIRFRAVCKTWRSSAPVSDPPDQLPWFLEIASSSSITVFRTTPLEHQRFYSASSARTLTIPFADETKTPPLHLCIRRGVVAHCLAFSLPFECTPPSLSPSLSRGFTPVPSQYAAVSFYNPLTQDLFTPPLPPSGLRYPSIVWTGTAPIRTRKILIINHDLFNLGLFGRWAFYDPCKNLWVEEERICKGTCYWDNMVIATKKWGPTDIFDAYTQQLMHSVPPPENEVIIDDPAYGIDQNYIAPYLKESYLVVSRDSSTEMMLRVLWFFGGEVFKTVEDSAFIIYRLECERIDGEPFWVPFHDIGDQVIFLQDMSGFSMTARPSSGFRPGCIYFINPHDNRPYVYHVLTCKVERVPCPFEKCTWFVPSLS